MFSIYILFVLINVLGVFYLLYKSYKNYEPITLSDIWIGILVSLLSVITTILVIIGVIDKYKDKPIIQRKRKC